MKNTEKPTNKKVFKAFLTIALLIFIVVSVISIFTGGQETEQSKELTKENTQKELTDKLRLNTLTLIRTNLNDPGSFKPLSLTDKNLDSIIVISCEYTAKNAFGGRVREKVTIVYDAIGNVKEIL